MRDGMVEWRRKSAVARGRRPTCEAVLARERVQGGTRRTSTTGRRPFVQTECTQRKPYLSTSTISTPLRTALHNGLTRSAPATTTTSELPATPLPIVHASHWPRVPDTSIPVALTASLTSGDSSSAPKTIQVSPDGLAPREESDVELRTSTVDEGTVFRISPASDAARRWVLLGEVGEVTRTVRWFPAARTSPDASVVIHTSVTVLLAPTRARAVNAPSKARGAIILRRLIHHNYLHPRPWALLYPPGAPWGTSRLGEATKARLGLQLGVHPVSVPLLRLKRHVHGIEL